MKVTNWRKVIVTFSFLIAAFSMATQVSPVNRHIIVGTGGVTGVYYPTGGALCRVVNKLRSEHGLRCSVESTDGSVQNLHLLRTGDIDVAVVQSDWLSHAWFGTGTFNEYGPDKNLRKIMTLYSEPFTVVARKDAEINTLEDLKGKRVNIGNPGSGQRATMEWLMSVVGMVKHDFSEVHELSSADQSEALCDGRFDAMIFVAGSPNGSIKEATTNCDSQLIPMTGEKLEQALAKSPLYRKLVIPGGIYRGNPTDVETFGVSATLVSSTEVDDGVVYLVTKSVFEELSAFTQLHPALSQLKWKDLLVSGRAALFHKGALRYFEEQGLTNQ